ncbi:hypothetical protein HK097_005566 [Rhizophlyctis rosea]|uniref:Mur ligase central domain-containing protein n=1 Tax=Rhizophlyctis rosea TaxID=64517 RepID=A0AAD5SGM3_9FUNG|nr:hypothetical protein HK097_005566 [Rhizophlyctis rosea]
MTGRRHHVFGDRIRKIAASLEPPLDFDLFFFREGYEPDHPRNHPTTLDFKVAVLRKLLHSIPSIQHVEFFDDRKRHLGYFSSELEDQQRKKRIGTFEVHFVQQDPNAHVYMPEDLERSLVVDLVKRSNDRVAKCKEELLSGGNGSEDTSTNDGSPGNPRKGRKTPLPRRTSASFFRDPIELVERPKYTALFLAPECQKKLLALAPRPENWSISGDHVTVCMGGAKDKVTEPMGGLGQTVHAHAIALGRISDRVIAVKVAPDPKHRPLTSENDTPHVTLYVAPNAKAKESNDIQEWTDLPKPIPIHGILREEVAVGIKGAEKQAAQPKQEVSIGKLVQKHHPHLSGKAVGDMCRQVTEWMQKMVMENAEQNRASIEWFIQGLGGKRGEEEAGSPGVDIPGSVVEGPTSAREAKGKINLGLENISRLLEGLKNPQRGLKVVHVAGTNGKGSICAAVSAVLTYAGYRTGRFNSPHLLHPSDAILLNDQPLSRKEYDATLNNVLGRAKELGIEITTFEAQTVTAFCLFAEHKVDIAVIEVGLGGRLDATNVCDSPLVCVFAAIGMDHVEFLGDTIAKIAREKAGIIKEKSRIVIAPQAESDAVDVLLKVAMEKGCEAVVVDAARANGLQEGYADYEFAGRTVQIPVRLLGDFQLGNMAAAVKTLDLLTRFGLTVPVRAVEKGLANVRWRGRLEWVNAPSVGRVLVDGAHNLPAAKALAQFINEQRSKLQAEGKKRNVGWIIGMTAGKDAVGVMKTLLQKGDSVYATTFSQPEQMPWIRAASTKVLRDAAEKAIPGIHVSEAKNLTKTLASLRRDASRPALLVLCGSLYLVADLYRTLPPPAEPSKIIPASASVSTAGRASKSEVRKAVRSFADETEGNGVLHQLESHKKPILLLASLFLGSLLSLLDLYGGSPLTSLLAAPKTSLWKSIAWLATARSLTVLTGLWDTDNAGSSAASSGGVTKKGAKQSETSSSRLRTLIYGFAGATVASFLLHFLAVLFGASVFE